MAFSIGEKANRALKLLLGLRNPRVASAMAAYGLKDADIDEGWTLLQALGRGKLGISPLQPSDIKAVADLDAWENRWFPIADASLLRRYPAVHARLFLNLSQTEGPAVAVSVGTFIERWEQMGATDGPYGLEGAKARELLASRGITSGTIQEARDILALLHKVAPPATPPSVEEQKADFARAEDALWAWYLEWSQVARVAVKQRVLLRQLGFLGDRGGSDTAGDAPSSPDDTPGAATAAALK
ncbi:MAG TPA: hypothetical protein VF881_05820 [Polyangiaceae bacterium]